MDAWYEGSYNHNISHAVEYYEPRICSAGEPWAHARTPHGQETWAYEREGNHQVATSSMAHAPTERSAAESIQEGMTTLVLTDLPYNLTLADLRDEMAFLGFAHSYDYIFYPSQKKDHFRGYCFVNFANTAEARRFAAVFINHKFEFVPSSKLSNVQLARTQGLQQNLAKLKPGSARPENFFIDMARFQDARGSSTMGSSEGWGNGGWHGRHTASVSGYSESYFNEPHYPGYY
eukprot:TRINITY_DN4198_c0_g1_i4.p1 TRINITY_DN4198_c0_g1~~TRINITY_DN4198_c0_g1_i4.p1  ORF type:complete len:263 (-),score=8.74 TRINITY_DN4198_c0_g1_i4:113-811(-)